jgi:hypothetical protein
MKTDQLKFARQLIANGGHCPFGGKGSQPEDDYECPIGRDCGKACDFPDAIITAKRFLKLKELQDL